MFRHRNPTGRIREYVDEAGSRVVVLQYGVNAGIVQRDGSVRWVLEGMDRTSDEMLDDLGWVAPWARSPLHDPSMHLRDRRRG